MCVCVRVFCKYASARCARMSVHVHMCTYVCIHACRQYASARRTYGRVMPPCTNEGMEDMIEPTTQ